MIMMLYVFSFYKIMSFFKFSFSTKFIKFEYLFAYYRDYFED